MDLGPDGTRLRRYEMAADRLFRSAWTKLERLRKERGEPLILLRQRGFAAEPAARPDPPADAGLRAGCPGSAGPLRPSAPVPPESADAFPALLDDPPDARLLGRRPGPAGDQPRDPFQYKTNPAPSQPAGGGRAARRVSLL